MMSRLSESPLPSPRKQSTFNLTETATDLPATQSWRQPNQFARLIKTEYKKLPLAECRHHEPATPRLEIVALGTCPRRVSHSGRILFNVFRIVPDGNGLRPEVTEAPSRFGHWVNKVVFTLAAGGVVQVFRDSPGMFRNYGQQGDDSNPAADQH